MRRPCRTRRTECRGAASVEAVVVLPFFVLLFVSVLYVRDRAIAKQAAQMQARSCAWLYSAADCRDVPPGCEGVLAEGQQGSPLPEIRQVLTNAGRGIASGEGGAIVESVIGSLLGRAIDHAFGRSVDARASETIDRPALYGGGEQALAGHYHLACNLRPQEPGDVALDAWRRVFGGSR